MDLVTRTWNAFWANLEGLALLVGWAVCSFAFAWAVDSSRIFANLAPFTWVMAAFVGAALSAGIWRLGATAQRQMIRNRYDSKLYAQSGVVDPLARTFESKRIYLNDFALPSRPLIENKTFIDCEIIGPANIILLAGNSISGQRGPTCDALVVTDDFEPSNGYAFRNCTFQGCSFMRITILSARGEVDAARRGGDWLRWIGYRSDGQNELLLDTRLAIGLFPASEGEAA